MTLALTLGTLVVVATWVGWRSARRPSERVWVCTREGLACFEPRCTWFIPWDAVDAAQQSLSDAEYFDLGAGPAVEPPLPDEHTWATIAAVADPVERRRLPTFRQPDGPPEAVLADLPEEPHELPS